MTYLLAVLAACANATSSVLQRKANRLVRAAALRNGQLSVVEPILVRGRWFIVLATVSGPWRSAVPAYRFEI